MQPKTGTTAKSIYPKGKIPKDTGLWNWAFRNFGGTGNLRRTIASYNKWYYLKHGNEEGFRKV